MNNENKVTLAGFVFRHGEKDLSAWQVDLKPEDEEKIWNILNQYQSEGCSVRNCYDEKFSEAF